MAGSPKKRARREAAAKAEAEHKRVQAAITTRTRTRARGAGKRRKPGDLPEQLVDHIAAMLRVGMYRDRAAIAAGVSPDTFNHWIQYAKDGKEPFLSAFRVWDQAEAQFEFVALAEMAKQGQGRDARLLFQVLERKHRDRWGMVQKLEHTGAEGGPIQFGGTADLVASKLEKLAKALGEKPEG